jgi:hypothetical protein
MYLLTNEGLLGLEFLFELVDVSVVVGLRAGHGGEGGLDGLHLGLNLLQLPLCCLLPVLHAPLSQRIL